MFNQNPFHSHLVFLLYSTIPNISEQYSVIFFIVLFLSGYCLTVIVFIEIIIDLFCMLAPESRIWILTTMGTHRVTKGDDRLFSIPDLNSNFKCGSLKFLEWLSFFCYLIVATILKLVYYNGR